MGWNSQQNPSGVNNPAVRDIPVDPATLTTTAKDARAIQRARARNRRVIGDPAHDLPIAANAPKADGFAPQATSPGQ